MSIILLLLTVGHSKQVFWEASSGLNFVLDFAKVVYCWKLKKIRTRFFTNGKLVDILNLLKTRGEDVLNLFTQFICLKYLSQNPTTLDFVFLVTNTSNCSSSYSEVRFSALLLA